ncbi:MAG TPA: O-antigen ligase family protein [Candidatus Paceibacterota bacterium]|nr:O-antigen ligase family protein [Candidatus Paceibacterota bacterium]
MQKVARFITLSALFIIPFLVLYVSNGLYFPFITGKGFAFRILVEIALAGWVVLALADKKYRPQFSWTLVLYGALVLWMIVADAAAVSPLKAFWSNFERMDGWVTLVHVFFFFVIMGTVLSADKLWKNWWLTFLASSALVSLYGVLQLMGAFAIHQGGVRLDATLGNAEYLAAYLLFAIGIAVWQAVESRGWLRYVLSALAALHVIVLFYTATRGAILGAIGAVILGAILWMIESGKKGRMYAAGALAVVVVLVGGFVLLRHSSFVQNNPTLSRFSDISAADGATRFTIWHMALEGFAARPVTGWGQEGFNYVFNTYYEPSLYAQEPWFDRAHNVFLDWLTAGGLPAFALFVALLIAAVVALYRNKNVSRAERVVLTSTLAAYAFQSLFVFDNLFTYIPLAALFALAHYASSRPWQKLESFPALSASATQTAAVVAGVLGIAVVWFVNVPNIAAGHDLILALSPSADPMTNLDYFKQAYAEHSFADQELSEQLTTYASSIATSGATDAQKSAIVNYAVTQMQAEVAARPADARVLLQLSLAYRAAGDISDAYQATQRALALSPQKFQIIEEAGIEAWQLGDMKTAAEDFANAYALTPGSDDAAAYGAAGKIITGDVPAGKQILLDHFGTTTVQNQILIFAYYGAKDYTDIVPLLEASYRNAPTPETGFQLATAYALDGRYTDAKKLVNAIVAANPAMAANAKQFFTQFGIQ